MAAIHSNGGNCWHMLGFNSTKRDALSSVFKISMLQTLFDFRPDFCTAKTKFRFVKTNQKSHAVYSIPCGGDCEKEYLGQSKHQFGTR
jgi:hypothetical protein